MSEYDQSSKKQILVIDDDPAIQNLLSLYLSSNGFDIAIVSDGIGMTNWLKEHNPDLIIMDLMLPGDDGLYLTQQLRIKSNIPIIMLTAKTDEIDKIIGLEMGADDYLPKPFSPRELLARIKSILRRSELTSSKSNNSSNTTFLFDDFTLNLNKLEFKYKKEIIALTTGDLDLLIAFVKNAGKILSREKLMDIMSSDKISSFDRSIDVRITRLRKKIEIDSSDSQIIQTIRGKGYRFNRKVISK